MGHIVNAHWLERSLDSSRYKAPGDAAQEDLDDIFADEMVVSFTMDPKTTGYQSGGRHVEYGFSYALGKKMVIVGPEENVFHALPGVKRFDTFGEFLTWLAVRYPVTAYTLHTEAVTR